MTRTTIKSTSGTDRTVTLDDHDDSKRVYLILRDPNQDRFLANINVNTEDLVAAINKIPGVTATYEKPKPPQKTLSELPVGTVFQFDSQNDGYVLNRPIYEVAKSGYLYSRNTKTYHPIDSDATRKVTVISEVPDE